MGWEAAFLELLGYHNSPPLEGLELVLLLEGQCILRVLQVGL
jgi:hypothetical protein